MGEKRKIHSYGASGLDERCRALSCSRSRAPLSGYSPSVSPHHTGSSRLLLPGSTKKSAAAPEKYSMAFSMATRTHKLAQPKANRLSYPDRRSVYWLDELPPERTGPHTKIHLTPRWSELCRSKKLHTQVTLSPIWEVSEWALRAVPSKRLCSLAQPRAPAAGWEPERPLLVPLNRATQTAVATARVSQLAQPKRRQAQENSGHKSKPVSMTHLPCRASAHTELLSTPKHEHPGFAGGRSVCWPVSRAARSYVAGERLLELSVPKARKALFEGYDPYIVSQAARSASPSPRIQELSLPLPRKCSSK